MKRIKKIVSLLLCVIFISSALTVGGIQSTSAINYKAFYLNDSWYSGSITETNTEQFHKFTLTSDGQITIKFMHYMSCYLYIYNEDFSTRNLYDDAGGGSSSSPVTDTYTCDLSKGSYYIKVSEYGTGNYKLSGNFTSFGCNEIEPNDFDNAQNLSESTIVKGCFTSTDRSDDWYKIYVPATCDVNFKLKHYRSCYLYIYNDDLSLRILYDDAGGGSFSSPVTDTYTYDLSKGNYYIKVSEYGTGKYELSWEMDFAPDTPDGFVITNNKAKKISMDWEDVDDCTGYQVQKKENGKWNTIATTGSTYFVAKKLQPAKKYSFRVRSYRTYKGKNYYSNWSEVKTTVTTPKKPTLTSVKRGGYRGMTVKWKKVKGATGYQIQYSTDKNFSSYYTYTIDGNKKSATVNYLSSYRNYYVRVVAYKTHDYTRYFGARSNVKSVYIK